MSRLIDADDLIEYIKIWEIGNSISSDQKEFIDCVNKQYTAFDIDKVVESLMNRFRVVSECFQGVPCGWNLNGEGEINEVKKGNTD